MWRSPREAKRWRTGIVVGMVLLVLGALLGPTQPAAAQTSPNAGGEFTPVTPIRVLDTRGGAPIRNAQISNRQVAGIPGTGVPPSGVLAVAMNVTVVSPNAGGFLTIWPAGAAQPTTSNLNFRAGQTVPNLVVSAVAGGGYVSMILTTPGAAAGAAHILIDVVGWYATSAVTQRAARLVTVTPRRLLDTRSAIGVPGRTPLGQGQVITLRIAGNGIPTSGVTGVVLNVTGVTASHPTFLTVYPEGSPPTTSNLNLTGGQTRPNLVMVRVGSDGNIRIFNSIGNVHVLADIVGYYQTGASASSYAGRVVPLSAPFRAFDTREYATRLGPRQREAWDFRPFVSSLRSGGAAVGPVGGLIMNVTATQVSALTYLSVFPDDVPPGIPATSTLNPDAGADSPNLAIVQLSGGSRPQHIAAYNESGYLHYLGDVTAVILSD